MITGPGRRFAALAAAVASLSTARAETNGNARAVIRGSGSDVTIVYRVPRTPPPETKPSAASDPLAEAIRLKAGGDDDKAIVDFLRLRSAWLPDVVDADAVLDLRRAGAGESVVAALSTLAAIDVGETGEGSPVQPFAPSEGAAYGSAFPDLVGMGYPYFSSYGGGYFGEGYFGRGRFGRGFGRHGFFPRSGSHFGRPFSPKSRHFSTRVRHGSFMARRMR